MTHEQKQEGAEFRTREGQIGDAFHLDDGRYVSRQEFDSDQFEAELIEAEARGAAGRDTYQSRVADWMAACFGPEISADRMERNHRFLEEAMERRITDAVSAERERCAKVCEKDAPKGNYGILGNVGDALNRAAEAIREGGEHE
ncbi:hypothetical protein [Asaia lannensis]|uniref:hypothetical protein n=1 Tax=Asaia lannensis TaxID=415421 RepID=UPI0038735743